MFWPFVLVTGLCIALLKLGAATVMVNVLSLALTGSLLVIAGLLVWFAWQWYRDRR